MLAYVCSTLSVLPFDVVKHRKGLQMLVKVSKVGKNIVLQLLRLLPIY